jgi:aminoglycoside phosphotransferase (APT) family kinase protein
LPVQRTPRSQELGLLGLFLGHAPEILTYSELVTRSKGATPAVTSSPDSVLLLPDAAPPTPAHDDGGLPFRSHKELTPAFSVLRGRLSSRACIAAVSHNRYAQAGRRVLATLRSGIRKNRVQSTSPGYDTPRVIALARALRDSGFSAITVYSLGGDPFRPNEIALVHPGGFEWPGGVRPIEWARATSRVALAPAFLLTAHAGEGDTCSFLARLVSAMNLQSDRKPVVSSKRIVRIVSSGKQKSVLFVRDRRSDLVVRIPHSSKAERSEAHAFAILQTMCGGRSVKGLAPQPLESVHVDSHNAFVETRLPGYPLKHYLDRSNRRSFAKAVSTLLRSLNPHLGRTLPRTFDEKVIANFVRPAIDRVLGRVEDSAVRRAASRAIEDSLTGCASRFGVVHGDFSVNNILVERDRTLSGVIDWEDALPAAPPVLDALNYLDSAHRHCEPSHSLADTVAMLANGSWPIPEEFDLLRQSFADCGIDFAYVKGFALVYWLFHVGPQLDYGVVPSAFDARVSDILRRVLT